MAGWVATEKSDRIAKHTHWRESKKKERNNNRLLAVAAGESYNMLNVCAHEGQYHTQYSKPIH